MKRNSAFWLLLALGAVQASGQTDNTFHVKQFAGTTVGQKVNVALTNCPVSIPCILVVDPSLAETPDGTWPRIPINVSIEDLRKGGYLTAGVDWVDRSASCKPYRGVVNVRDCGGVADGAFVVGACANKAPQGCYYGTSNTIAIRKAIAALGGQSGVIEFPVSGTNIWMVGAPQPYKGTDECETNSYTGTPGVFDPPPGTVFRGAGRSVTVLMANPGTGRTRTCAMFQNTKPGSNVAAIEIHGMRLDGNENTDGAHNDWYHPNNNFGTSVNAFMAFNLINGPTQVSSAFLVLDDFILTGFEGAGTDFAAYPHAFFRITGPGIINATNGWIVSNEWAVTDFENGDSKFTDIYWQQNGNWNNFDSLNFYWGGTTFLGNYFGGSEGGTAQVVMHAATGSMFVNCVFDNNNGSQLRFVDEGTWGAGGSTSSLNLISNSVFSQAGAYGSPAPFISFEGHSTGNVISSSMFSNGPKGHTTYIGQELGSATGNSFIGTMVDPGSPPGKGCWSLSVGSRVTGSVGCTDTVSIANGFKFAAQGQGLRSNLNSDQGLWDDSASGGWNFSFSSASTNGIRFWKGVAGTTKIGQIDPNGNWWISSGSQIVYRCTTAGTLPVGALTVDNTECTASTDTGLRVK